MEPAHVQVALIGLVCTLGAVFGCALCKDQPARKPAEAIAPKETTLDDYSVAVIQCASFLQRMAFDSGKRLPSSVALTFCTELEKSPDVSPQATPTPPVTEI